MGCRSPLQFPDLYLFVPGNLCRVAHATEDCLSMRQGNVLTSATSIRVFRPSHRSRLMALLSLSLSIYFFLSFTPSSLCVFLSFSPLVLISTALAILFFLFFYTSLQILIT